MILRKNSAELSIRLNSRYAFLLSSIQTCWRFSLVTCTLFLLVSLLNPLQAEPVGLENGQGWLFSHRGNCYLIVPKHVVGTKRELSFFTRSPVAYGDARVMKNLTTAHDLAIAFVAPGLEDRCTTDWRSMPTNISKYLDAGNSVTVTEVRSSGLVDSLGGKIAAFDADMITLAADQEDSFYQGRSGSALMSNGVFIGMAIEAKGTSEGLFLRADEIHDELRGLIDRSSSTSRPVIDESVSVAAECTLDNKTYAAARCSAPALSEDYLCSGLVSGRPARFAADTLPLVIDLSLSEGAALRLESMSHRTAVIADDSVTAPKSVLVLVDSSTGERKRWKRFGSRDSAPDGSVTISNGNRPLVRHIRFIVQSAWENDKPIEVGCLVPR